MSYFVGAGRATDCRSHTYTLFAICSGADAAKFLQGLTTNDIHHLKHANDSQFTCFLNNKGRALAEATVSLAAERRASGADAGAPAPAPLYLLDVHAAQKDEMLKHLKTYKLRSKVDILDLSASHAAAAAVPTDPFSLSEGARNSRSTRDTDAILTHVRQAADSKDAPFAVYRDPRATRMGVRTILPRDLHLPSLQSLPLPHAPELEYHALRLLLGIPEGREAADMVPLEWNLSFLNGVSFDKGCYVGQELMARTHFRGLIRKRVLPVYFGPAGAPPRNVACADPIATALVRHSDGQTEKGHGVGGHGHGKGHGPAQTHAQHKDKDHSSKIHHGQHALVNDSPAHTHHLRLPFPYVDRQWRGHVGLGDGVVSADPEDKESRVGKVVAWVPGLNLGLAMIRLEHIDHTLPRAPSKAGASAAAASSGAGAGGGGAGESHRESVAAVTGVADAEDDCNSEAVVASYRAVHERCKARPVNFYVSADGGSGSGAAAAAGGGGHGTQQPYHVTPILPTWWRHVAHGGVEETPVVTTPGA